MSPMISTAAAPASPTDQCGAGCVSGTPGASTSAVIFDQSAWRRSLAGMPAETALATRASSSSKAMTSAPPASNALALASPELPSPNTATRLPANVVTGIMNVHPRAWLRTPGRHTRDAAQCASSASSQLERRQPDKGENDCDDPEPDHDLRLGPAELLEMVMDRRHLEHAFAGELEREHLHDHRDRFEDEQSADHRQHDLVLGGDRHGAEQAAERERAGIAHEDGGGRRVEPQESKPSADQSSAHDRKFAGSGDVMDLQVVGEDRIAGEIRDHAKAQRRDDDRNDGQPVEAVGEIHRVASADDDEGAEHDEEPAEVEHGFLEERKRQRCREGCAPESRERETGDRRDDRFDHQPGLSR